ncbi:murein L,D-transpeptidase catalytic domain family protein [Foetidibacter luteolus]|uniref:murein L,D-transpeptidase catalytic domain family protein n=1 Tax=Foetidibacter luteolus TaxID=2608880 RepID=UPI00129A9BC9|nr:murein L,D-transpeptidase catalytic domain family protein [Foetidibacter luteolus]
MQTRRHLLVFVLCIAASISASARYKFFTDDKKKFVSLLPDAAASERANQLVDSLYVQLGLDTSGLSRDVFFFAYKGYQYLLSENKLANPNYLTICDYSQSSAHKRLYVVDLLAKKLMFNTYVSHGKKSGEEFATSFSNSTNSHKSSLGFFVTGETYRGRAGFSLRFDGMEPGINDRVRARGVVLHGSRYVNEERIDEKGFVGRSFGCPAVPMECYRDIIETIKDGSCFFTYNPDMRYGMVSKIMNANFEWPAFKPVIDPVVITAPENNELMPPALMGVKSTANTGKK